MAELTLLLTSGRHLFQQPPLQPGETPARFLLRTWPNRWHNLLDRLAHDEGVDPTLIQRLARGELAAAAVPRVREQVTTFLHMHMPLPWRTCRTAAALRQWLRTTKQIEVQLLWVREAGPLEPTTAQVLQEFEVEICPIVASSPTLPWPEVVPHIRGEIVLLVPGGMKLFPPALAGRVVERLLAVFRANPLAGVWATNALSAALRVQALRALLERGFEIPANIQELGLRLVAVGYLPYVDPILAICDIEDIYLREDVRQLLGRRAPPEDA